MTVNPVVDVDQYPLPTAEDIFATLAGGQHFSKLDLSHAYNQLELDDRSKDLLTINTHKGLYRPNRLHYGISSAPAIFQRTMDQIVAGLPGMACYLDDVIITAKSRTEHLQRLEEMLSRLEAAGVRLKKSKCEFFQTQVAYLGHVVDAEGLHPNQDKVTALQDAPRPSNAAELSSYLGLLRYYMRFLPDLSTVLHPLDALKKDNVAWNWTKECDAAFEESKKMIMNAPVLTHYDVNKPLSLACDASYGLGAVLSHRMQTGEEKPVAFASRKKTEAECNYSQIEREALAIILGIKKLHQYIWGRRFTLETDHKPLVTILGPKTGIPSLAAARLQRWAVLLAGHTYDIVYKKGTDRTC